MFYTYLLQSRKNNRWHTGYTKDLRKRFKEHNEKENTHYTNVGAPYTLIYYESCHNKEDAFAREKYLKSGAGKKYIRNRLKRFLSLTG